MAKLMQFNLASDEYPVWKITVEQFPNGEWGIYGTQRNGLSYAGGKVTIFSTYKQLFRYLGEHMDEMAKDWGDTSAKEG